MSVFLREWAARVLHFICVGSPLISGPVTAAPDAASLAGHYYLAGITELGSELLLTRDGHFQWILSYGAIDRRAEGDWTVDGKTLILTSRSPSGGKVTFALGKRTAWNEEATRAYRDRLETHAIAKSRLNCPLASLSEVYAADPAWVGTGEGRRLASAIPAQAAATERARRAAQAAVDRLKAHPEWKDDLGLSEAADAAIADFKTAQATLTGMRDEAGVTSNKEPELDLPPKCLPPDTAKEAAAMRGIAVNVVDGGRGQQAGGIRIEARYDRGAPVSDWVDEGVAFFPLAAGQRIGAFSLHILDEPKDMDTVLAISLAEPSIQVIDADLGAFVPPAFSSLRLTINADGSLSPQEMLPRGTYRRAMIAPPAVTSIPSDGGAAPHAPATPSVCDSHGWEADIGRRIQQAVVYPPEAFADKIEGTAFIRIDIDRSGHVTSLALDRGSGSDLLDRAAMRAAGTLGALGSPPCGATGAKARIPVSFKVAD